MTIWEAAIAAAAAELQTRIDGARTKLRQIVGPDVTLPPHDLVHELGIIVHDGQQGLLFTDQGTVRYVVREAGGQITAVGEPVRDLADLGRVLNAL